MKVLRTGLSGIATGSGAGCDPKKIFFEFLFYICDRTIENFFSFIDQDNLIADFFHLFHPVGAEDNGCAICCEPENFIFDQVGIYRIETTEGFIQNNQFRLDAKP